MDSSYVCNEFEPHKINKRDRYVGTNMSKVMRDKFNGKKLVFVQEYMNENKSVNM